MLFSIDGRRRSSGQSQGAAQNISNNKPTWPSTLRVDAPAFKPASPPKSNPWTNFASNSSSKLPNSEPLSPSDPPLPSQFRNEEEAQEVESNHGTEAARSDASQQSRTSRRNGSKSEQSSPMSRPNWLEETLEPKPKAASVDGDSYKEDTTQPTSTTNPWFSSSNPWSKKIKAKSELPDLHSSDPPLPPISETESTANEAPCDVSQSTVLGSPLKNEISMVDDEIEAKQTSQTESSARSESPPRNTKTEKAANASRPPSRESTNSLTSADTARRTARSVSTSSEYSQKALIAAALRGDEIIWLNSYSANIHVVARSWNVWVHRHIVEYKSHFFKECLPPPAPVTSGISVRIDCAPEALAHCLLFMYTNRLESIRPLPPYDKGHLPRCVLMYTSGVFLRMEDLIIAVLEVVESTARELAEAIQIHHQNGGPGDMLCLMEFTEDHLSDAIDLIYDQPSQELMKPLRMVMAAVLDHSLLWLLQRQSFKKRVGKPQWDQHMGSFLRDIVEYRGLKEKSENGSVIPDKFAIRELFKLEKTLSNDPLVI